MSALPRQLPEDFVKLLAPLLGSGLDAFLASYIKPPLKALRFSNRGPVPDLPFLGDAVPWAPGAFYVAEGHQPGAHPLHWAGAYYLQEPSAMAAAGALQVQPGERVLDLCAAPGGKSGQLAEMAGPEGFLLANDPVPNRAVELSRNLERMGVINAAVTCEAPERLAARFTGFFDKILVDAPCSGEGMFKKEPAALEEWHSGLPEASARLQKGILGHAAAMLRPGGLLAYSTCTFNTIENEGVVLDFLERNPDFRPQAFTLPGLPQAESGFLRLWPHLIQGEGHFIALLRREDGPKAAIRPYPNEKHPLLLAVQAALGDWVQGPAWADAVLRDSAVMLPLGCPDMAGLKVLRLGLHLGGLAGKTPRPDHALALAMKARRQIEINEEEAGRFRAGEVLSIPETLSGFAATLYLGWQLGWGKAGQGVLKNHYPKGLRRFTPPD